MEDIKIKQLTGRIWYLPNSAATDRPVLAVILGDQYTLMLDAGNSPKHAQVFLKELKSAGLPKPDFLVLTHWHWDHILGSSSLNIPSFAHTKTKEYMEQLLELEWNDEALLNQVEQGITTTACAEYIKKEYGEDREAIQIILPTFTFTDELSIDLVNITCVLKHVGGDHSDDSCVLYIEEENVLFIGDSTSPNIHSPQRYYRLDVITSLLQTLEAYNADFVIHSHDAPMDRTRFGQEVQEYRDLINAVRKYGNDFDNIAKEITIKWNRALPNSDLEFIQYFINGIKI